MKLTTIDFGPQAGALEAFLDQVDEAPAERWLVVLQACRADFLDAAREAAREAARVAAWEAAWEAALSAVALLVRDLISTEHYDELTRVMRASGFVVHPDDEPLSDES